MPLVRELCTWTGMLVLADAHAREVVALALSAAASAVVRFRAALF
jgi:hypothetical protein